MKIEHKIKEELSNIIEGFSDQLSKVFQIIEFDKEYIELVITQLNDHKINLIAADVHNKKLHPDAQIMLLKSIISSGPKQSKYQPVYNQCMVLLVSHFASVISSVFNETLTTYLKHKDSLPGKICNKEYKFKLGELNELQYDLSKEIGRMIARRSDISFQDMKSIARAFDDFFNIQIERNQNTSNIIAAQALRHAIVHNGEKVDNNCIGQLKNAADRVFLFDVSLGEDIKIDKDILEKVKASMIKYVEDLSSNIQKVELD